MKQGWAEKTPSAVRWPEGTHPETVALSELEDPEGEEAPVGGASGRGRSYREVPKGEELRRRSPRGKTGRGGQEAYLEESL